MKAEIILVTVILLLVFSCEKDDDGNDYFDLSKESEFQINKDYFSNNQPRFVEYVQMQDGKEQVVEQKVYFDNGQLKMNGKLTKEGRTGKWVAYFNNGKPQSEGEFKNGLRTGKSKIYYENGNLMYDGQYESDKKVGVWKFYNNKGEFVKEEKY